MNFMKIAKTILIASIVTVVAPSGFAVEYFLRADTTTLTMPDNTVVTMWGFAMDSAFEVEDGTVAIPGPMLTVPPGDNELIIHLKNKLTAGNTGLSMGCPLSLVIPGQTTTMTPVKFGAMPYPQFEGRVRSLTHETSPGNTVAVDYVWSNFRPGSYVYHSGTHIQCHVQMGLYGGVTKDFDAGEAYSGITYDAAVPVFFSEIDPAFHEAVATNNYGPGKAMTSTIDYAPKYYLINGQPYVPGQGILLAGDPGDTVLLRLFNMGLQTRCPLLQGGFMTLIAEDGQPYQFSKEQYVASLPAGKTIDALITSPVTTVYPLYDRRLGLTNAQTTGGGMLSYVVIGTDNIVLAINSVTATQPVIADAQTSQLMVDADNGTVLPLSYNWIVPVGAGSVSDPNIANPIYTPPDVPAKSNQVFTLTVEVSDGLTTISDTVDITVIDAVIFAPNFNGSRGGFSYLDDAFGTAAPVYADGARLASGGYAGGTLQVSLGGLDNTLVKGMSGGWQRTFNALTTGNIRISFMYNVTQSPNYETNEVTRLRVSLNGTLISTGSVSVIRGDGDGGPEITTGWRLFEGVAAIPATGNHTLVIGGFNNRKNNANEFTTVRIDNVSVVWN